MQALFAKVGFQQSGMIHNLDPNDPELKLSKSCLPRLCLNPQKLSPQLAFCVEVLPSFIDGSALSG